VSRDELYLIGVPCHGIIDARKIEAEMRHVFWPPGRPIGRSLSPRGPESIALCAGRCSIAPAFGAVFPIRWASTS